MKQDGNQNTHYLTIFISVIALIIVGILVWHFTLPRIEEVVDPANNDITEQLPQEQKETAVEEYIRENISALSPEAEVLGGVFYVTDIRFTGTNSGIVEYEDGHIALVADFMYTFDADANPRITLSNVRENIPE
jgi:hypothetical protein